MFRSLIGAFLLSLYLCVSGAVKVGIAGTGAMGNAIGGCLLRKGYEVVAWNRTPEKTKNIVELGAVAVNSISDLFKDADVVIMMVVGDENMRTATGLLKQVGKGLQGKTVVQWTSHDPLSADDQSKYVESEGGRWLGGAMLATPDSVCTDHGLYFLSGATQEDFNQVNNLIGQIGGLQYYGSKPGMGSLYDIAVVNTLMFGAFGHMLSLTVVKLGGGDVDVYDALFKMLGPLLLVDIGSTSTNIYKSGDYNPARKTLPIDSFVSALHMWQQYFRTIGVRSELLDILDVWIVDLRNKHPELQKEDLTILSKYVDKNDSINFPNEL
eukprot:gene33636-40690_t